MTTRSAIRLARGLLAGSALLLWAATASASQQALVQLSWKEQFIAGTTFVYQAGSGVATVGSTTPTPSIMWPANIVTGAVSFTYSGAYTPFASRVGTYMNLAATLQKSHAGAAPSGGSTLLPVTGATTKCFASIPPVLPGPPALPGSCFPRNGTAMRSPGSKKFGGTARMLMPTQLVGTFVTSSPPGLLNFANFLYYSTPQLTGPGSVAGNYGLFGFGTNTNTVLGTPRNNVNMMTEAPLTTGVVTAMGGSLGTAFTRTGSHNFNTANLTGMISMVRPHMNRSFNRDSAGNYIGPGLTFAAMTVVDVTFLPEPGVTAMLGCGVLGLGGLARLRKR